MKGGMTDLQFAKRGRRNDRLRKFGLWADVVSSFALMVLVIVIAFAELA